MKYNLVDTNTWKIEQKNVEIEEKVANKLNYAYALNYSPLRWRLVNNDSSQSTDQNNTTA